MADRGTEASATGRVLAAADHMLSAFFHPGPLLVAFSGGGDSTALLWALSEGVKQDRFRGFSLHACTIDHGLRAGSTEEALAAGRFARDLGIDHQILTWHGPKPSGGIQAAAREARYDLLTDEAARIGAVAVLAAHSAEDQAETIAMRRARGEGEGLSGMDAAVLLRSRVWMVRPFLGLDRETLRRALREQGLAWSEDPSNQNARFERVRIRTAGLAGETREDLAPSRHASSLRQAEWLAAHARVEEGQVATMRLEAVEGLAGDGDAETALFKLSAAIAGKTHLRSAAGRARILSFLRKGVPGRMTLGGSVYDLRSTGLYLYRECRGLPVLELGPGEAGVWDGRYRIENHGAGTLTVKAMAEAGPATSHLSSGVPSGILKRAALAGPRFDPNTPTDVLTTRQIAAHAGFLPRFELPVAECFASLFRLPFPPTLPVAREFRPWTGSDGDAGGGSAG